MCKLLWGRRIVWAATVALVLPTMASAQLFQKTNPQREVAIGRQVAREVEQRLGLCTDEALQNRVQRIGSALVDQLAATAYPYEFKVLASEEMNAFALPGGFIYFYEGLVSRLPNDDALAFIVGHEITHAAHRHWRKRVEKLKGMQVAQIVAAIAGGQAGLDIARLATQLMSASYSREHERDADATGMELLWRAGFDTQGAVDATQFIVEISKGSKVPRYFGSHPPAKDRYKRMTRMHEELQSRSRPTAQTPEGPVVPDVDLSRVVGDLTGIGLAPNPWFPLAVGNEWTYDVKAGGAQSSYTVRVLAAVQVNGSAVYRTESTFGKGASVPAQLLTTANGVWRRPRPASPDSEWQLDFVIGTTSDEALVRDGWEYQCGGSEQVSLPCGTFPDALVIRKQGAEPVETFDLWFVRGIGLVKRVCVETGVTETLVRYRIPSAHGAQRE